MLSPEEVAAREEVISRLHGTPITKPFYLHGCQSGCSLNQRPHVLMWHGPEPWLCWKHPDGQWVTEAPIVLIKCLECGVLDGCHADGCSVEGPDDGTPTEAEQHPPTTEGEGS